MSGSVKRDAFRQSYNSTKAPPNSTANTFLRKKTATAHRTKTTEHNTDLVVQIVHRVEVGVDLLQQVAQRQVLTELH